MSKSLNQLLASLSIFLHFAINTIIFIGFLVIFSIDLFNQAIMLSGSELSEWAVISKADAREYAQRLCKQVGCPTSDSQQMVDCLRLYRSFEQIVNASALVAMMVRFFSFKNKILYFTISRGKNYFVSS